MAVSLDGKKLYLLAYTSPDEFTINSQILVFSLPNLTLVNTLNLSFEPSVMAAAAHGRLFVSEYNLYTEYSVTEINPTTGAAIQSWTPENQILQPIFRTDPTGNSLYVGDAGLEGPVVIYNLDLSQGGLSLAKQYGVSVSKADMVNDFAVDEAKGFLYLTGYDTRGLNLAALATGVGNQTWSLPPPKPISFSADAVAVDLATNLVYVGSEITGVIAALNRDSGAIVAQYPETEGFDMQNEGLVVTGNGTVMHARSSFGDDAQIGFISTKGIKPFIKPLFSQTIDLSPLADLVVGDGEDLNATASSGLFVNFRLVSGPATLTYGFHLSVYGTGTVVIEATQPGNSLYSPAPPVIQTYVVPKSAQTISPFAVIADQAYSTPFAITPPTADSGLPVKVTVTFGSATIRGSTVNFTGVGAVTLAANQPGNSNYSPAMQVMTSFIVNQASQTIAALATIPAKTYGEAPFRVFAPKATSGLPVTLSILSGPATISSRRITMTGVGTVVLAANQAGNANYSSAPQVTYSFIIN
jgi:hypothetical protein